MLRRRFALVALFAAFTLVMAACGDDDDAATTTAAETTTTAAETTTTAAETTTTAAETTTTEATTTTTLPPPPPGRELLVCQVTDFGGIDDDSFNETAWNGALRATEELEGVTVQYLESQAATDYRPNIDSLMAQGCDVIITVGFNLAADTALAACDNPDQAFVMLDDAPGPYFPWAGDDGEPFCDYMNVKGVTFQTDEAAFLAGYVSAGMTETGVVGTFGGIAYPTVTIFMNGFTQGVNYYNAENGTDVVVLGWDIDAQDGLFTGNFESLDDGRTFAQNLVDEGADIILPVAGPVGLGSAALCQETGACKIIGVDSDWFASTEYGSVALTSILKKMDNAVFDAVSTFYVLDALGNNYLGTLVNGGVGLAPFHEFEDAVPQELKDAVAQLEADIIAVGSLADFLGGGE